MCVYSVYYNKLQNLYQQMLRSHICVLNVCLKCDLKIQQPSKSQAVIIYIVICN